MSASFSAALIEKLLPKRETLYGLPERKTLRQAIRVEQNRRKARAPRGLGVTS